MAIGNDPLSHMVLECVQCRHKYSNLKDSDVHVKETHHRVKVIFKCPKCEKYFGNSQVLQLHLRVHNSEDQQNSSQQIDMNNTGNSKDMYEYNRVCDESSLSESTVPSSETSSKKFSASGKKATGLTKIRLEDCLRCDACSCIYIDENDYNKHMKNFHRTNSSKKPKQRKGCRSCCKHCNCQGNHQHQSTQNERGNNNLFHFSIKDRWTKMVSCRLNRNDIKSEIKSEPDDISSEIPPFYDYTHLLSQVEVKIKTEPPDDI